jgi:inward rectifier potassium channel
MSLMTGLIFSRFARPDARLLFADNPVISMHDGRRTLMVRFANQRNSMIGSATARLWLLRNERSNEGSRTRRFTELPLQRNESPALVLSWTLFHVIDEASPLYGLSPDDMAAVNVALIVVVSGYDEVTAQTVHARKTYEHDLIRHGQRYVDIMENLDDGRLRVEYGRFHDTLED